MKVEKLYLELTRMCTIECEHCLRGCRRNEFMSLETINNVLRDIEHIELLLLTGGEPLLALKQIKELLKVVTNYNIGIDSILLVTNGTVLNDDIINTLDSISNNFELKIGVSNDMFHYLELIRLNILEKCTKNVEYLKQNFNAIDYLDHNKAPKSYKEYIYPIGNASNLTLKRLDEINILGNTNYAFNPVVVPETKLNPFYCEEENEILGTICVDVNGNVVSYSLPFDEEDNEAIRYDSNVNKHGLLNATINYINNHDSRDFKIRSKEIYDNIKKY